MFNVFYRACAENITLLIPLEYVTSLLELGFVSLNLLLMCKNKNLAIVNRSRVSCAHSALRASIGINITP